MRIVENTLHEPLDEVLSLPLFCFVGTVSRDGEPRVSPLWYLWEEERMWILADRTKTYYTRLQRQPKTAIAVVDFDPVDARVRHIGMRGTSELVDVEPDRVKRKLTRYLGGDEDQWDPMFHDLDTDRWKFLAFTPETIVARNQSYQPSLPDNTMSDAAIE